MGNSKTIKYRKENRTFFLSVISWKNETYYTVYYEFTTAYVVDRREEGVRTYVHNYIILYRLVYIRIFKIRGQVLAFSCRGSNFP